MVGYSTWVSHTYSQSGIEANLRNPSKSASRSISDAMMAGSILRCSLVVLDENQCPGCQVFDWLKCTTCRWPMSLEANCDVPPCSLAEHRSIRLLPQFSTIV